jgi:1-acyl-sn-glycerol-3-phosphate acyltransferase
MAGVNTSPPIQLSWFAPVERVWRLIAIAISFAIFGVGGVLMAVLYFPVMGLFIGSPAKRAQLAQASVHGIWWFYVRIISALGAVSFSCDRPDVLRDLRGTIVVANHPSLLDVVFLMSFMRNTRAVVKAGVWRNPFMRGVVTAADYIPNQGDPERLVSDCADALRQGANLVIFPQGSRTPPGGARRWQKGFAHVALAAGAPVQVVSIRVDPPMLGKGEPWYTVPRTRSRWTIRVHERIDTVAQYGSDRSAAAVRRLTNDVAARLEGLIAP